MKRILIIIISLFSLCQLFAGEKYDGCIYLSAEKRGKMLVCTLHNESSDTIYLFDTYLEEALSPDTIPSPFDVYRSPFLRRYNPVDKSFTFSFKPLIKTLKFKDLMFLSDVIVLGPEKIVKPDKTIFKLRGINPDSAVTFSLSLDIVCNPQYVEEFRPQNERVDLMSRGYSKLRNKLKLYYNETGVVNIEVAVYRRQDIKHLMKPSEWFPEFYFLEFWKTDPFMGSEDMDRIVKNFIPVTLTILTSDLSEIR